MADKPMLIWSSWIDCELDDEEKFDSPTPITMSSRPDYPFGMRICLEEAQLKKAGMDQPEKGDKVMMRIFGEVTFVSDGDGGRHVEIQIQRFRYADIDGDDDDE